MQQELSISKPGNKVPLPVQVLSQLSKLRPGYQKTVTFFGGHPISLRKKDVKQVFSTLNPNRQSPYLICEKTDGVRYILVVTNQCSYFVSREGTKGLVAYQAYCKLANNWANNPHLQNPEFEHIIHILDGELVQDKINEVSHHKYLIFDALVCFGKRIMQYTLRERLKYIQRFYKANQMLLQMKSQMAKKPIEIKVKDFFRLSCNTFVASQVLRMNNIHHQPTSIQFLLYYYIKCLPHENDGLIFNHEQKPYLIGPNPGYLKWKPASLNTVDFLVVPNKNLINQFGKTVLDLYVGFRDEKSGHPVYRNTFYNFTVVEEHQFQSLQKIIQQKMNKMIEEGIDGPMVPGVIAQCKYEPVDAKKGKIFSNLLSSKKQPQEIYQDITIKFDEQQQIKAIKKLQTLTYLKYWTIYKFRIDKNNPNDHRVVDNIEQSIKDNIKQDSLVENTYMLLDLTRKGRG